jgi:hypothetical protein
VVEVADPGRGDGGVRDSATFEDRDAGAEDRVGARVVCGAVYGVEQPGASRGGDLASLLLGEDGVFGVALRDGAHHELLAQEVHLGNYVFGGLLRYLARGLVAGELELPGPAGQVANELV